METMPNDLLQILINVYKIIQ